MAGAPKHLVTGRELVPQTRYRRRGARPRPARGDRFDGDLRAADSELYKLSLYVDGERAIGEADVSLLTPYVSETSMFDMVDALAEGRTAAAWLPGRVGSSTRSRGAG